MTAANLAELRPAASGARMTGDDVQHAVAWHAALRTQVPQSGVHSVTVEAYNKGNVDDVFVAMRDAPDDYIQVKATVSAERPATTEWLTATGKGKGKGKASILQRFYRAHTAACGHERQPTIKLVTNRSIQPGDPILEKRDSNDRLAARLFADPSPTAAGARRDLGLHLGCGDEELYNFLSHLQLHTDASEAAWREKIREVSWAAGVTADDNAFLLGVGEIRQWVKRNRTAKSQSDIRKMLLDRNLLAQDPFTVFAIKALEEELGLLDPALTLDWVRHIRGTEARNRRGLHDPRGWNEILRPELHNAQRHMRNLGARRILITGSMRLPTWFASGVTFQETAGFTVAKVKDGTELWTKTSTSVKPATIDIDPGLGYLQEGDDIALVLALSHNLVPDVKRYLASNQLHPQLIVVTPPGGPANDAITGPGHGYATALAIRNLAREINGLLRPPTLHLFMATPAAFAVILGSVWDRVPPTQLYEDLVTSYEPAFLIPN